MLSETPGRLKLPLLNAVPILWANAEMAHLAAEQLRAGEDLSDPGERWTYQVERLPNGKAKIAVYDEQKEFVAYFGR